jgi:hypothetical protein
MKQGWLFFIAASVALGLMGPRQLPSAQFKASIEGVVRDHGSRSPLGGVRIHFKKPAGSSLEPSFVTTDPQGQFVIEITKAGRYELIPGRSGYVYSRPARLKEPRPGVVVQVTEPGPTRRVELSMAREGILSGQILDSVTGQPVPSIVVFPAIRMFDTFGNISIIDPRARELGNTQVRTNDRGEYRFFGLQPGEYYLVYSRNPSDSTPPVVGRPVGYYPGVDRLASAVTLQVDAGKETRVAPTLVEPTNKAVQVRFRYGSTKPSPSPLSSPTLIFSADWYDASIRAAGQDDVSAVRMTPGHHNLLFQVLTTKRELLYSHMAFDVGTESLEKEVTLSRGVNITGSVKMTADTGRNQDAAGIRCSLYGPLYAFDTGERSRSTSRPEGCMQMQISTGNYQLQLSNMPADAFVVSAKSGENDVIRDGIEVDKDVRLDIDVATPGAVITGIVTDDNSNPLSHATVALVPDAPYRKAIVLYRSDVSTYDGRFELRGVGPGAYRVFTWADLPGPAYRNSEFLKKYEGKGLPLKIENSTAVSINLTALE